MASNIDPTFPAEGDTATAEERANFQAAHDEIVALQTGKSDTTHLHGGVYEPANANIQSHIASVANPHVVTQAQVGLANVDNTADADKPVSNATQTELDGKTTGPAGSVDGNLASFNGVSGKVIQDAGVSPGSFDTVGSAAAVQSDLDAHKDLGNHHMSNDERSAMDAANLPSALNPIATIDDVGGGGGGQVHTVVGGVGITVNDADPVNPIVNRDTTLSDVLIDGHNEQGDFSLAPVGGSLILPLDGKELYSLTIDENIALAVSGNPTAPVVASVMVEVVIGVGGPYTISIPTIWNKPNAEALAVGSEVGDVNLFVLTFTPKDSGSYWITGGHGGPTA